MNKKIKKITIFLLVIIISIIILFSIKNNSINNNKGQIETENKQIIIEEDTTPIIEDEGPGDNKQEEEKIDKPIVYLCPTPKKEYDNMFLLNIGQTIGLPDKTYIPENLVELSSTISTRKNICLTQEVKDAFESMAKGALVDKNIIKVSSGFRSYEYQQSLITNAVKSGKTDTAVSIAKAGYSEHQLGTAIDITGASIGYGSATGGFDETPEELWLRDNAYLYGFAQSYPKDKEDVTGYKYEPWHYRYIGIDNAKKIKDLSLTITEFLK